MSGITTSKPFFFFSIIGIIRDSRNNIFKCSFCFLNTDLLCQKQQFHAFILFFFHNRFHLLYQKSLKSSFLFFIQEISAVPETTTPESSLPIFSFMTYFCCIRNHNFKSSILFFKRYLLCQKQQLQNPLLCFSQHTCTVSKTATPGASPPPGPRFVIITQGLIFFLFRRSWDWGILSTRTGGRNETLVSLWVNYFV